MIKEIVDAGGAGFLIPAVLLAILVAGVKGLFGLFGRRSQTRKEFLEHWDALRTDDDVWLEVTVRHLLGEYMPASVIRLALSQPHKVQALRDISEIWPLVRFDPYTHRVTWKSSRHATKRRRTLALRLLTGSYYVLAFLAAFFGWYSSTFELNSLNAWVYGVVALECLLLAFLCLHREDAFQTAARLGDEWEARINGIGASLPSLGSALTHAKVPTPREEAQA